MAIARLLLEIEIPHAHSLKDRRQAVRSIKERLRRGFNLSVAEMDEALVWNRATLGMVAISSSTSYLKGQMEQIEHACYRLCNIAGAEIVDCFVEILPE